MIKDLFQKQNNKNNNIRIIWERCGLVIKKQGAVRFSDNFGLVKK